MSEHDPLLTAIRKALDGDPRNGALWSHYADLLLQAGKREEALEALRSTLELGVDELATVKKMLPLLREAGHTAEALIRAEKALEKSNDPAVQLELAYVLHARGDSAGARQAYQTAIKADGGLRDDQFEKLLNMEGVAPPASAEVADDELATSRETPATPREKAAASIQPDRVAPEETISDHELRDLVVSFEDVAGLEDVKRQINLRIIAPFRNKEMFAKFRRRGGGGILLYGPPGCGKTFIARATAGECHARFVSVGIHEIVDKWWGESEKMIHALFEDARRQAPTVLFFDEFDALGSSRGQTESQFWKTLVDQLLQEMDGVGGQNQDVLVFAATNLPWSVDSAFRRPGRFDRLLFVPPPDAAARAAILQRQLADLPGGQAIDLQPIVVRTELMTGADLVALCERASERALEESLTTGRVVPVTLDDFQKELAGMQSSASEWFSTARNYARYSNEGRHYDELIEYLKRVRKW